MVAGIRAALGDERYESLYAQGARMSLDQALALVLGDEEHQEPGAAAPVASTSVGA